MDSHTMIAGNLPVNPASLLTISQASSLTKTHPQTLRGYVKRGKIRAYRVGPTGWLRFDEGELRKLFGIREEKYKTERRVAILARVSSVGQKDYLATQIQRLKKVVKEREGESTPLIFSEICSSFGTRTALYALLDSLLDNQLRCVYYEYRDRLSRTNALTNLIIHLAKVHNTALVQVEKTEDSTLVDESYQELIEFCTVLSARANGRKSASRSRIDISTDCLKRAFELKKEGLSERMIANTLTSEGYKNPATNRPYQRSTIGNRLRISWALLEKQWGNGKPQSSFARFCELYLVKTECKGRPTKLNRVKIVSQYLKWCDEHKELAVSDGVISRHIEQVYKVKKGLYDTSRVVYFNLALNMNTRDKG